MRLVTYSNGPQAGARSGVRVGHRILDIEAASRVQGEPLPSTMKGLLQLGRGALSRVRALAKAAQTDAGRFSSAMHEERAIRLLPPVPDPDQFVCVGKPELAGFLKVDSGLVGHDARVPKPAAVGRLDYEPELVFVIGKRALGVRATDEDCLDYAMGVTVLNGLTDRDLGKREIAPLGPEIVTMDEIEDPYDLWMVCAVNGEERLRVNTRDHAWKLPQILEHFSRTAPIEPGDLFSTASRGGASNDKPDAEALFLQPGDVVECSLEGVTTLRTTIIAP
jgi:2-keto-4-pentenoate hydratase/2-oxohepta-3-ene-1,7-dioic acid hydratase in catechol pathway